MKKYASWAVIVIVVVIVVGFISWYSTRPGEYEKFATCIKDSGAKFYGAFWCPYCQKEKSYFGRSQSKLPYVECSATDGKSQLPICTEKKIESYPTWEFSDGTRRTGALTLQELSDLTSCPLVKDEK